MYIHQFHLPAPQPFVEQAAHALAFPYLANVVINLSFDDWKTTLTKQTKKSDNTDNIVRNQTMFDT